MSYIISYRYHLLSLTVKISLAKMSALKNIQQVHRLGQKLLYFQAAETMAAVISSFIFSYSQAIGKL